MVFFQKKITRIGGTRRQTHSTVDRLATSMAVPAVILDYLVTVLGLATRKPGSIGGATGLAPVLLAESARKTTGSTATPVNQKILDTPATNGGVCPRAGGAEHARQV
jgi:hypothetical protein